MADLKVPIKVLDVACGTGDFTIEIAKKVAEGSEVLGIDISEGMMVVVFQETAACNRWIDFR